MDVETKNTTDEDDSLEDEIYIKVPRQYSRRIRFLASNRMSPSCIIPARHLQTQGHTVQKAYSTNISATLHQLLPNPVVVSKDGRLRSERQGCNLAASSRLGESWRI